MAAVEKTTNPEAIPTAAAPPSTADYFALDAVLRGVLFAATVVALLVMSTAEQTKDVPTPAKFDQSPAFIYFVSALTVASLYSLLTVLSSIGVILHPEFATKFLIHFAFWDVLMLGIVSSATGAAGGVAYIGLKGYSHAGWAKFCNTYDKFCQHIGSAVFISLIASILLVLLVMLSAFSLHSKIR